VAISSQHSHSSRGAESCQGFSDQDLQHADCQAGAVMGLVEGESAMPLPAAYGAVLLPDPCRAQLRAASTSAASAAQDHHIQRKLQTSAQMLSTLNVIQALQNKTTLTFRKGSSTENSKQLEAVCSMTRFPFSPKHRGI
jgi:hypothetical protein